MYALSLEDTQSESLSIQESHRILRWTYQAFVSYNMLTFVLCALPTYF